MKVLRLPNLESIDTKIMCACGKEDCWKGIESIGDESFILYTDVSDLNQPSIDFDFPANYTIAEIVEVDEQTLEWYAQENEKLKLALRNYKNYVFETGQFNTKLNKLIQQKELEIAHERTRREESDGEVIRLRHQMADMVRYTSGTDNSKFDR